KEVKELFANKDYDVDGLEFSQKRKVLTMITWTGDKQERHILDAETQTRYDKLAPKFEGYEFWIYGEDDNESTFVVWAGTDRQPGKYYLYDAPTDNLTEVATLRPWINENDMAEMK